MSGIAGLYRFDGGAVGDEIASMTGAIDHRGPDGEWTWREGRAALGHQRFETTPEASYAGSPPERDGRVLTFDGRIDNRRELLAELDIEGPPGEVPDADVVLAAYERWGEECPEHLVGAYAFAVFDPESERLFLARDHVGVRPLYYHRGDDRLAFASEIKALWAAGAPCRLNEERVADMLSSWIDNDEYTFHEEIHRLPPAHAMVVDAGGVETTEYWRLDPDREVRFDDEERYAERFRELYTEAVRCRLRSVGPVGSTLSGGLDSSSNVSMACHLAEGGEYEGEVHSFSAVFDAERTPSSDEREYIEAVVEACDVVPHYIQADERSPLGDVEEIFHYTDGPELGNNFYLHWNVYRTADEHDVRILLDGLGGDTTVSHGMGYLPELLARGRWVTLAREVRRLNERFDHAASTKQLLWTHTLMALAPNVAKRGWHRLRGRDFVERTNPALDRGFVERIGHRERIDDERLSKPWTEQGRHAEVITGGVIPVHLERASKTAMHFDVEPRYPFFDRRLMEFCFALPPEQKIGDGWTRLVLRRAMEGVLPEEIRWRGGKGHLSASFWTALRDHASEEVRETLAENEAALGRFLDVDYLESEYESFAGGDRAGLRTLWYPTLLGLWLASSHSHNN